MSQYELPADRRLIDQNNHALWVKALKRAIGKNPNLYEYLGKLPEEISDAEVNRIVVSDPVTPAEQTKRNAAIQQCQLHAREALNVILDSVSDNVADSLPDKLTDCDSPQPKLLFEWLDNRYGSATGTRQADLLGLIHSTRAAPGLDPLEALTLIKVTSDELRSSVPQSMTALTFIEKMAAFAMLRALPNEYSLWASTIYKDKDLSVQMVLNEAEREYNRQVSQGLVQRRQAGGAYTAIVPQGVPVYSPYPVQPRDNRQSGKVPLGKDGNPMKGKDHNAYCTEHRCYGHLTRDCHKLRDKGAGANIAHVGLDLGPRYMGFLAQTKATGQAMRTIVVDSAATHTFIKDEELLSNVRELIPPIPVRMGNNNKVLATKAGDLVIDGVCFNDALFVPDMVHNLLSTQTLDDDPTNKWELTKTTCALLRGGKIVLSGRTQFGLYVLDNDKVWEALISSVPTAKPDSDLLSWHRRLAHLSLREVWKLGRAGKLDGEWSSTFVPEECVSCIMGKGKRLPSPPSDVRANAAGQVVHVDLWGPAPATSTGGNLSLIHI